jgi:hypothetical protein
MILRDKGLENFSDKQVLALFFLKVGWLSANFV